MLVVDGGGNVFLRVGQHRTGLARARRGRRAARIAAALISVWAGLHIVEFLRRLDPDFVPGSTQCLPDEVMRASTNRAASRKVWCHPPCRTIIKLGLAQAYLCQA